MNSFWYGGLTTTVTEYFPTGRSNGLPWVGTSLVVALQPAWMPHTAPSVNGFPSAHPIGYGVWAGASGRVRTESYEFGQKFVQ